MVSIPKNKINIDDIPLRFGKHSGKTPNELFDQGEFSYLVWLGENMNDPDVISEDLYDNACIERYAVGDWGFY